MPEKLFPPDDPRVSDYNGVILKKDEKVCPKCGYVIPVSGECGNCE